MTEDNHHISLNPSAQMSDQQPDAPYRGGTSGKYKLLIKSAKKKFERYEYVLTDAEGKEYAAEAKEHYQENALLRCMVTFEVKSAHLVVTDTTICKKQDLALAIPEPVETKAPVKKPTAPKHTEEKRPSEKRPKKNSAATKQKEKNAAPRLTGSSEIKPTNAAPAKNYIFGIPSKRKESGIYRLTVLRSAKLAGEDPHSTCYTLCDAEGGLYRTVSSRKYPLGAKILCNVAVVTESKRILLFVSIVKDATSLPTAFIDGEIVHRKNYTDAPKSTISESQASESAASISPTSESPKKGVKHPIKKAVKPKPVPVTRIGQYEIGQRYKFTVTANKDDAGRQVLKDEAGQRHILTSTQTYYSEGDEVTCTVISFPKRVGSNIPTSPMILGQPRLVITSDNYPFAASAKRWALKVQGLEKHKCGKPFTCNCCGHNFPANAGVRIDLKDFYFCNACASQIFEPGKRGNHHFYISTPTGHKR